MRQSRASQPALWSDEQVTDNGLRDPTFTGNKSLSIHRWVNWIAGFSADFVDSVLDRYLPADAIGRATVLDPFAGVGTTNVEALRHGFHTYGFELNPFAALAARCKLQAARLDPDLLLTAVQRYAAFMLPREEAIDRWWNVLAQEGQPYAGLTPESRPPALFRTREPFFSQPVELKILFTLDFVKSIDDPGVQQYFWLALGSTLVSYSNYSYEPSLCSRSRLGKPLVANAPVGAILAAKLANMLRDARDLRAEIGRFPVRPTATLWNESFFDAAQQIPPGSVDLLITSPPYLNNYHYVRNTRPQLYWLGFVSAPKDLKQFETKSFGKFWQTVREGERIELTFELPDLEARLAELSSLRPEKGIYGGRGWANYAASYFNDSYRFFEATGALLKPGGHAVIVVGNSLLQGVELQVDEILADIARLQGLEATVERIRSKRVGNSIVGTGLRQKPQNGRPELYEAAVVVQR